MGRKPKYKEPTAPVTFKCPVSKVDEFKSAANNFLKGYLAGELTVKTVNAPGAESKPSAETDCGCQMLGLSPTGKEIWRRCKEHKK